MNNPLDRQLAVKFYKKSVYQKFLSEKENKQIYKDVDYISIRVPGDNYSDLHRPVKEEDKERFDVQWNNYQKRQENVANGTPIDMLPGISPAEADNYRAKGFETIEQLAGMNDTKISKFGFNARSLVKKAQKFLKGDKLSDELQAEVAELKKQLEELKQSKEKEVEVEEKEVEQEEVEEPKKELEEDEPTNSNTKRNKRNWIGRRTDDSNRK